MTSDTMIVLLVFVAPATVAGICVLWWRYLNLRHIRNTIREFDEKRNTQPSEPRLRLVTADEAHLDRVYGKDHPHRPATKAGCSCIDCSVDRYMETGKFCESAERPPANWRSK